MSSHSSLHSPSPPAPPIQNEPPESKEEQMAPSKSPIPKETLNGSCTPPLTDPTGGRLKFFLDGKFVLELSHHRDGSRAGWVPVSRKTYWPPTSRPGGGASATATVPSGLPVKQESSTSHSDDNSSLRSVSSPWSREHRMKQSAPHRGQGKYLPMFSLVMPRNRRSGPNWRRLAWKKRRKPFHSDPKIDCDPSLWTQLGLGNSAAVQGRKTLVLENVIKQLTYQQEKKLSSSLGTASCQPSASKKSDAIIVSPRKRILRQMEAEIGRKRGSASTSTSPHSSNYSIRTLLSSKKESNPSPFHRLVEAQLDSDPQPSHPFPSPPAHLLSTYLPFGFLPVPTNPHLMHPGALANPFSFPLGIPPLPGYSSQHWRAYSNPLLNDKGKNYTAASSASSTREIEAPLNLSTNGRRRDADC